MQPFLGVGVGILHAVNPRPVGTFASPAALAAAEADASDLGTSGFGTLVGGLEFKVGRFVAFGQYQLTSSAGNKTLDSGSSGRLFSGATHTFTGGMRVSLGSAKDNAARVRSGELSPARDVHGEPATANRSGQSAALVMPMLGVASVVRLRYGGAGHDEYGERRIPGPSSSRVMPSA